MGVHQARIDWDKFHAPDQVWRTREEKAALAPHRQENRELRSEKDF